MFTSLRLAESTPPVSPPLHSWPTTPRRPPGRREWYTSRRSPSGPPRLRRGKPNRLPLRRLPSTHGYRYYPAHPSDRPNPTLPRRVLRASPVHRAWTRHLRSRRRARRSLAGNSDALLRSNGFLPALRLRRIAGQTGPYLASPGRIPSPCLRTTTGRPCLDHENQHSLPPSPRYVTPPARLLRRQPGVAPTAA